MACCPYYWEVLFDSESRLGLSSRVLSLEQNLAIMDAPYPIGARQRWPE